MKYEVYVSEVWTRIIQVEANTKAEAFALARLRRGKEISLAFDYIPKVVDDIAINAPENAVFVKSSEK